MREHQCYDATTGSDWSKYWPWKSQNRKADTGVTAKQVQQVKDLVEQHVRSNPDITPQEMLRLLPSAIEQHVLSNPDITPQEILQTIHPMQSKAFTEDQIRNMASYISSVKWWLQKEQMSDGGKLRAQERSRDHGVPPGLTPEEFEWVLDGGGRTREEWGNKGYDRQHAANAAAFEAGHRYIQSLDDSDGPDTDAVYSGTDTVPDGVQHLPYDLDSEDNEYGNSDEDPDYDLGPDNPKDKAEAAAQSHAAQLQHHNASDEDDEDDEDDAWSCFRDFENGYTVQILIKSKVEAFREMHPLDVEVSAKKHPSGSFRHFTRLDFADVADILTWTKQLPDCAGGGMPLVYAEQAEEFLSNHEVHFKVKETPVQQKGSIANDKARVFSKLVSDYAKVVKPFINDRQVSLDIIRDAGDAAANVVVNVLNEDKTIDQLNKFASREHALATTFTARATKLRHKLRLSPGDASIVHSVQENVEKAKKARNLGAGALIEIARIKTHARTAAGLARIYNPELRHSQKATAAAAA